MEDETLTDSPDETMDDTSAAKRISAARGSTVRAKKVAGNKGTAPKPPGTRSARGSSKKGAGVKGPAGKGGATYNYKVCETGSTTACSAVKTIVF